MAERCPADGAVTIDRATLDRSRRDTLIGTVIAGRFEIERRLGRGGYGTVYEARHKETGGPVALKLMRPDLVGDERIVRRFYLEAQNTHRLQHPNTVRVIDFGIDGETGALYFVTELVDGRTLADEIGRPMAPRRSLRIIRQVLKSLGEAHGRKLVHRDIKPQNIMLTDQFGEPDFVKVLDFGIARSLDDSGHYTVGVVGTPLYMAPEQCLSMAVDARTDLYSVGCVLYHLLAGRPPVEVSGPEVSAMAVMSAQVQSPAPPLVEVAPGCPPALSALVARLLEKDPERRPATAAEVLEDIERLERALGPALDRPLDHPGEGPTIDVASEPTLDPLASGESSISGNEPTMDRPRPPPDTIDGAHSRPEPPRGMTAEVVAEVHRRSRWLVAAPVALVLLVALTWWGTRPTEEVPVPTVESQELPVAADQEAAVVEPAAETTEEPAPAAETPAVEALFHRVWRDPEAAAQASRRGVAPPPPRPELTAGIRSSPREARVAVQETGEEVGRTPYEGVLPPRARDRLEAGRSITLVFKLAGHRTRRERVSAEGRRVSAEVTLTPARARRPPKPEPAKTLPRIR